jgi:hypothetical protein
MNKLVHNLTPFPPSGVTEWYTVRLRDPELKAELNTDTPSHEIPLWNRILWNQLQLVHIGLLILWLKKKGVNDQVLKAMADLAKSQRGAVGEDYSQ